MTLEVRRYRDGDAPDVYAVFHEAVHIGARHHYCDAQRRVWAPHDRMPDSFPDRLAGMETFVARDGDGIAGVMAATRAGYLDLAFVRPRWMGRGMAQALYEAVIKDAQDRGAVRRMTTHASHLARPFFARNRWRVDYPETVCRDGVMLDRFAMSLDLPPRD
ncbi:GNAT family N-acetyltransferase [Arenibacterium sp. CAU 1754]